MHASSELSWCIGLQSSVKPPPTLSLPPPSLNSPPPPTLPLVPPPLNPPTSHTYAHTHTHTHTQEQYVFIHDAILESVTCGDTQIGASDLRAALRTLRSRAQSGETGFEHQFGVSCVPMSPHSLACGVCACTQCGALSCQILEKVSPNPAEAKVVAAQRNHKKNRSMEFPPGILIAAFTTALSPDCVHCA